MSEVEGREKRGTSRIKGRTETEEEERREEKEEDDGEV
jgi:hypothetical protein